MREVCDVIERVIKLRGEAPDGEWRETLGRHRLSPELNLEVLERNLLKREIPWLSAEHGKDETAFTAQANFRTLDRSEQLELLRVFVAFKVEETQQIRTLESAKKELTWRLQYLDASLWGQRDLSNDGKSVKRIHPPSGVDYKYLYDL